MNRLKFRAWNGRAMEYGGFSIHATGKTLSLEGLTRVNEKSPVMQYTGLKDKNGVGIYEGDIIEKLGTVSGSIKSVVKWNPFNNMAGFQVSSPFINIFDSDLIEVIGNIFQSPELVNTLNQEE